MNTDPNQSQEARRKDEQATEFNVYSAFDDMGEIHLYDDEGRDLKGWPASWPSSLPIGSVRTFLHSRGINLFTCGEPPKRKKEPEQPRARAEQAGSEVDSNLKCHDCRWPINRCTCHDPKGKRAPASRAQPERVSETGTEKTDCIRLLLDITWDQSQPYELFKAAQEGAMNGIESLERELTAANAKLAEAERWNNEAVQANKSILETLRSTEAQAAAMRVALEQLRELNCPAEILCPSMTMIASHDIADAALSSDAGKALLGEVERLELQLAESKARISDLESKDAFSRKELNRGNQIIDELRQQRDRLTADIAESNAQMAKANRSLKDRREVIGSLQTHSEILRAELENARKEREEARETNRRFHRRVQAVESGEFAKPAFKEHFKLTNSNSMWSKMWKSEFDRLGRCFTQTKEYYEVIAKALGLPYGTYHSVNDCQLESGKDGVIRANVIAHGKVQSFSILEVLMQLADKLTEARQACAAKDVELKNVVDCFAAAEFEGAFNQDNSPEQRAEVISRRLLLDVSERCQQALSPDSGASIREQLKKAKETERLFGKLNLRLIDLTRERDGLREDKERLQKTEARFNEGLSKIAQAVGVLTPLELIALADNNEQDYIDLLLKWIARQAAAPAQEGGES